MLLIQLYLKIVIVVVLVTVVECAMFRQYLQNFVHTHGYLPEVVKPIFVGVYLITMMTILRFLWAYPIT